MELAVAVIAWVLVGCWLWLPRLFARSDSVRTDLELTQAHEAQRNRLAAAGREGGKRCEAALDRMGRLMVEMKKRGLVQAHVFVGDGLFRQRLERVARQRYCRSVSEIQARAGEGEPAALYQLGMLFRIAREDGTARGFLAKAAEAGNADGQFAWALALLGMEEQQGPEQSREALTWLKAAANQGHEQAASALAGVRMSMPLITVRAALRDARRRVTPPAVPSVRLAPRENFATPSRAGLAPTGARRDALG